MSERWGVERPRLINAGGQRITNLSPGSEPTDAATVSQIGGGGIANIGVDTPPASPSVLDDEGNDQTPRLAWGWVNQSGATIKTVQGYLEMDVPAAGSPNNHILQQAAPTGDGLWWSKVALGGVVFGQGDLVGVALIDSTGAFLTATLQYFSGAYVVESGKWTSPTAFEGHETRATPPIPTTVLYVGLRVAGSTVTAEYSYTGATGTWVVFGTWTIPADLVDVHQVGIVGYDAASNAFTALWDFARWTA